MKGAGRREKLMKRRRSRRQIDASSLLTVDVVERDPRSFSVAPSNGDKLAAELRRD